MPVAAKVLPGLWLGDLRNKRTIRQAAAMKPSVMKKAMVRSGASCCTPPPRKAKRGIMSMSGRTPWGGFCIAHLVFEGRKRDHPNKIALFGLVTYTEMNNI